MSTYTQLIYHIVFTPKHRSPILEKSNRPILFKYITGLLKNKKCHLYQINGVEDHIHILTHVHPTIPISNLVKDIKLASSSFIKSENLFPLFQEWQVGYGAFTCSYMDKEVLIKYIANQEEHHKKLDYKEELINLLKEHGISFDEKYLL